MDPITVFRSADESAEEDATAVAQLLSESNISARLLDDSSPGVPEGAWEVCVDRADSARADAIIATRAQDQLAHPDESHDLDLVTVFRSAVVETAAESEAMTVKGLLDAAGIPAVLVGDARFPNFPEEVKVPRLEAAEARRVIAEALAAGSGAAEQEEAEGERQ